MLNQSERVKEVTDIIAKIWELDVIMVLTFTQVDAVIWI